MRRVAPLIAVAVTLSCAGGPQVAQTVGRFRWDSPTAKEDRARIISYGSAAVGPLMDRILNANAAKNRLARTVDVTVPLIDILVELKQPEKTMAEVERRYSKSDESGRYELILIASQIGTSQAEEFILRAERNEHGFLRSGALIQLKNFADEPSVAKVLQETMEHDPEDGMRWSAACGLANIDPEAIGMLDQMAREKKAPIDFRRMSIDHIGASPIPKAKAILERLAKFGPEDIRGYAQNALLVRSDKGVSK